MATMYEIYSYISDAIAFLKANKTDRALESLERLCDIVIKEYGAY